MNESKMPKIFPYTIIRISGEPIEGITELTCQSLAELVTELISLEEQRAVLREGISQALAVEVASCLDKSMQNTILNLRRDLFNERRVESKVQALRLSFSLETARLLDSYLELTNDAAKVNSELKNLYDSELIQNRQVLGKLCESQMLKRGLVLSSQTLLSSQSKHSFSGVSTPNKKERQVEAKLLQYLTRIHCKTSPFSTFTHLSVAKSERVSGGKVLELNEPTHQAMRHQVRLNNHLLKYILNLLTRHPATYPFQRIKANETIEKKHESYHFLANQNNEETFHLLKESPVLECVLAIIPDKHNLKISYGQLIDEIQEQVDSDRSEIDQYLRELIDYGFLEFDFGVSGTDPDWVDKLLSILESPRLFEVAEFRALAETLKSMVPKLTRFGESDVSSRIALLNEVFDSIRISCERITAGISVGSSLDSVLSADGEKSGFFGFKPENIVYEDCCKDQNVAIDTDYLRRTVSTLNSLLQRTQYFLNDRDEFFQMRDFFIEKYGKLVSVPVLDFYESYYREVKLAKKTEVDENSGINRQLKEKSLRDKNYDLWKEEIAERLKKCDFSNNVVELTIDLVPDPEQQFAGRVFSSFKNRSFGAFLQTGESSDKAITTVNAVFAGYGKMYSRFLSLFESTITDEIRKSNAELMGESLFFENNDGSFFNANIHPPLMPYEISIPGGQNSLEAEKQLRITDFEISYDNDKDELVLNHLGSTKRTAFSFDLCFEGSRRRSKLFQLLGQFTDARQPSILPLTNAVNSFWQQYLGEETRSAQAIRGIRDFPRIVLNPGIVLQRKKWLVKTAHVPARASSEEEWQYFTTINKWRVSEGIPDEVFVVFDPITKDTASLKKEVAENVRKPNDNYKPQFICFTSPLFVSLFEKELKKAGVEIKIEEALPRPVDAPALGDKKFATELVVQWNS